MTLPMTTPPTPPSTPTPTSPDLSATAIAELGAGLTRLMAALIPLSARAAEALSTSVPPLIARVTTALDASGAPQGSPDPGRVAGDLVGATAGLSMGLLKAAVHGLNTVVRTVDAAVTEATQAQQQK